MKHIYDKTKEELIRELQELQQENYSLKALFDKDITGRRQTELALKESEIRFQRIIDVSPVPMALNDEQQNINFLNPAFVQAFGYNHEEIPNYAHWRLKAYPDFKYRQWVADTWKAHIEEAKRTGAAFEPFELTVRCKDGKDKIVMASATSVSNSFRGNHLVLLYDITDLKKTEEALRKSEEQYQLINDSSQNSIYSFDLNERFTSANRHLCINLKLPAEQIIGKTPYELGFSESQCRDLAEKHQKVYATDSTHIFEGEVIMPDGSIYVAELIMNPLHDKDGRIVGIAETTRDITESRLAAKALKESESRFRAIINVSPVPIALNDEQHNITFLNPAFIETFGYSLDDIPCLSKWWPYAYPDPDYRQWVADTWNSRIEEARTTGTAFIPLELTVRCKDGTDKIVLTSAASMSDSFDGIHLVLLYDITERKKAEQELIIAKEKIEESETNLKRAQKTAKIGSWIYDMTCQIIWSEEMFTIFGVSSETFNPTAESFLSLIHPDDQSAVYNWISISYTQGISPEVEFRAILPNNSIRFISGRSERLCDADGKPIRLSGTAQDITERKQAAEALKESEEKLSALFGSMSEMVVTHELIFNETGEAVNYRITDCNNAFSKITGINQEDAIGKLSTEVYKSETAPYLTEYARVGITGKPLEYITYFAPMDKHFMISVVSPKKNHFATITNDITAIRQIQQEISAKNKELENYLYVASHDLRSPLVNIQGFSRRLQKQAEAIKTLIPNFQIEAEIKKSIDKITNEDIPKTLNFILSNVTKMDTLINGLLQISRTGRIKMTIRKIDISQLFKNIIAAYNFQITELSATVIIKDLPDCYGDENQLNQLFSNIIGNAIKYRDKNKKLIVEIDAVSNYNKIIYRIKDSGIGMAPRHLEKIWDVFYRVDFASPEAGEGIGLSLAKRIADKHKGKIWAESEEGISTTFYVELQKNEFAE